jgi:hypothetical protein
VSRFTPSLWGADEIDVLVCLGGTNSPRGEWACLRADYQPSCLIASTTSHIVDQLTKDVTDSILGLVFQLVVLDESSQIPVTLALKSLAAMRDDAQLCRPDYAVTVTPRRREVGAWRM